jgi:hypothetical protein
MSFKIPNRNRFVNLSLLVILFIVSILIRFDNLKTPMGRHHEYITAHVLCTNYMFYKYGASKYYFSPVINFDSEAEKKCSKFHLLKDKENNFYYYSYPPFAFLLPHFVFSIFNCEPNVLGIRIISLIIHFCSALLIFILVLRFFNKSTADPVFFPALLSYFLYLFSTGNLWFHSQVYFADMLVQPLVLGLMVLLQKHLATIGRNGFFFYSVLFLVSFLAVYTEYLALFFVLFTGLFLLISSIKERRSVHFIFIATIFLSAIMAIGLMLFQYSRIDSLDALIKAMTERYKIRSGYHNNASGGFNITETKSYENLSKFYYENYGPLLYFVLATVLVSLIFVFFRKNRTTNGKQSNFLKLFIIILLSYFLHMAFLFNFNAIHDFGTLKFTLLAIPLCGFLIGTIYKIVINDFAGLKKVFFIILGLGTILFFHFSINKYYELNSSAKIPKYISEIPPLVKKYGDPKTFICSNTPFTYETCFFSKRRVESIESKHDLIYILNYCNIKEALMLFRNTGNYDIVRINYKGDTISHFIEPLN